jgi:hypothetical protein
MLDPDDQFAGRMVIIPWKYGFARLSRRFRLIYPTPAMDVN